MRDTPCVITALKHENYLYVHVKSKTINRQKAFDWLAEVSLLSAESGSRRILIDRDIPKFVMDEELAEAIDRVADVRLGVRLAIVNRFSEPGTGMARAVKRLGKAKPNIRFFDDLKSAQRWLGKDQKYRAYSTDE
jgi:hypothetical protein